MTYFFDSIFKFIESFGYIGILISTGLEYGCFPISSEILLPFIGFMVYKGKMSLLVCIVLSVFGAAIGCSFCFFMGSFGRKSIEKLCRKKTAISNSLKKADSVFERYGKSSVFIFRLFPIARTYISFPAGMSKMGYFEFLFYSMSGAAIWNSVLISAGYFCGEHWTAFTDFLGKHKAVMNSIFFAIILIIIYIILKEKAVLKHQK